MAHLCCGKCNAKLVDAKLLARDVFLSGVCLTWASEAAGKEIYSKFAQVPASGEKAWQIWKLHCRECDFDIGSIVKSGSSKIPVFPAADTHFLLEDGTKIKLNTWRQLSSPAIADTPALAHLASPLPASLEKKAPKARFARSEPPRTERGFLRPAPRLPSPERPASERLKLERAEPESQPAILAQRGQPESARRPDNRSRNAGDIGFGRAEGLFGKTPDGTGFGRAPDSDDRFGRAPDRSGFGKPDRNGGSQLGHTIRNEGRADRGRSRPERSGHGERRDAGIGAARSGRFDLTGDHKSQSSGQIEARGTNRYEMKLYLRDPKPFPNQHHMRSFVLGAATISDVGTLLQDLGSQIGLKRINEICSEQFSISAGGHARPVSFQRVILPFIRLVTDSPVANSTLTSQFNEVLACIHASRDFTSKLTRCLISMRNSRSIEDREYSDMQREQDFKRMEVWEPKSWVDVVETIADYVHLILCKFNAIHDELVQRLIDELEQSLEHWLQIARPSNEHEERNVRDKVKFVARSWDMEKRRQQRQKQAADRKALFPPIVSASAAEAPLDGPGNLSLDGKRHNNDFDDITQIRVPPTSDEILCQRSPYLPRNVANAMHHLSEDPVLRHLDTHFRLLRHDFVAPLCKSLRLFIDSGGARSAEITKSGRFKPKQAGQEGDNVDMFVFRNVVIKGVRANKSPPSVVFMIECDQPQFIQSRSKGERKEFWKNSNHLSQGSLVCLYDPQHMIFGEINFRDLELLAEEKTRLHVGVSVWGRVERETLLRLSLEPPQTEQVLVQSNVSYFAYEPVLTALQNLARTRQLPFAKYLCPSEEERNQGVQKVGVPAYLEASHKMDLSCILREDTKIPEDAKTALCTVPISSPELFPSELLAQFSTLDETQVEALKAGLTQEVALLQGPPGTGKTYVGILLILLFLKNYCTRKSARMYQSLDRARIPGEKPYIGPILCVCYTNHAIDQLLCGLLDKGVKRIVRIGGRCTNERLEDFNLRKLSTQGGYGPMKYKAHKRLEEAMQELEEAQQDLEDFGRGDLSWGAVRGMLEFSHPMLYLSISGESADGFLTPGRDWHTWLSASQQQRQQQQTQQQPVVNANTYAVLNAPPGGPVATVHLPRKEQRQQNATRSLDRLLSGEIDAWDMSRQERKLLHDHWKRDLLHEKFAEMREAMEEYESAQRELENVRQTIDRSVISSVEVIGMTTSGVAKHQNLIAGLGPRIVLVEEAAEVLEAHILTCLSAATQHLVLIGDHLQLRPKIECYQLSAEFSRTHSYNLDVSLFERLVSSGNRLPVHTLSTQRRMRPEISNLIRESVYPNLLDHDSVKHYPNVLGMSKNLFFFDHNEPEDAQNAEGMKSKRNRFEVTMIMKLSAYLLRQGYQPGEITILTPYVGQLLLLRNELSKVMMVFVDEQDEVALAAMGEKEDDDKQAQPETNKARRQPNKGLKQTKDSDEDKEPEKEQKEDVVLTKSSIRNRVRMATIDNFQGEESKVVIISLVRNNDKGSIGFLKTMNRTNVLLSRAMHGMYILGNSRTLRIKKRHQMWEQVLTQLESKQLIGNTLSLRCQNHPQTVTEVRVPKDFDIKAGDGGCSLQCEFRLPKCGHCCPRRCHPDDPHHTAIHCPKPCMRIRPLDVCPHSHACPKQCGDECGHCEVQVKDVLLPCGHTKARIECYKAQEPAAIYCRVQCAIEMPNCGHKFEVDCSQVSQYLASPESCKAPCGEILPCSHECKNSCGNCYAATAAITEAAATASTATSTSTTQPHSCKELCGRGLSCGHACAQKCHGASPCLPCSKPCLQKCFHSSCDLKCTDPCSLCVENCTWTCEHRGQCLVPCGTPCLRLPCDLRCEKLLDCKHRCPGLCGELCPSSKYCIEGCPVSAEAKEMQVDVIELLTFQDYIEEQKQKDAQVNPLLFLPCGHMLTMSSLDGHFELDKYYRLQGTEWKEPLPFEPQLITVVKRCPWCQEPIVGGLPGKTTSLKRYGRVLNTIHMDILQRKYVQKSQSKIQELAEEFQKLEAEAAQPTFKLLLACQKLQRFEKSALKLLIPPTQKAFAAAQAALQRESGIASIPIQAMVVPQGDQVESCYFLIGMAKTSTLLMTLLSSKLRNMKTGDVEEPNWPEAEQEFQTATKHLDQAKEVATACHAKTTAAYANYHHARLLIARARSLHYSSTASEMKERRLGLVAGAKIICDALSTEPSIAKEARVLLSTLPVLEVSIKNEKFYQPISEEETKSVMAAFRLNDRGFTGQGHWYRCKNGHIYVITECGGAMQEGTCNECGEKIGGSSHRLRDDNTSVMERG